MPKSIEEDLLRNNAISLQDLYGHALAKNPCPGIMKFTILVDPSLVIITIHLVCMEDVFFNTSILHVLAQNYLPLGLGS